MARRSSKNVGALSDRPPNTGACYTAKPPHSINQPDGTNPPLNLSPTDLKCYDDVQSGSLPENVNFGIKASTVRQFLTSSGLSTKWSDKSKPMSTKDLAKIAKRQTVMVVCYQ